MCGLHCTIILFLTERYYSGTPPYSHFINMAILLLQTLFWLPGKNHHTTINYNYRPAPNVSGFIAQLVEHRTGNREVTGSNPIEVLNFLQASLRNCINCVHCNDHFFIFIHFLVKERRRSLSTFEAFTLRDS